MTARATTAPTPTAIALAPSGVPDGAQRAVVEDVVDGDTFRVRLDGRLFTVDLMGVDAPDVGGGDDATDCYADEATARLARLLPSGREVWLDVPAEVDLTEEPASRYVWVVNADGDPYMVNRSMLRHGYAVLVSLDVESPGFQAQQLAVAEESAVADEAGLWTACGLLEPPAEAVALVTNCAAFASYNDAQAYYAALPDAQPFIDPNLDGRACEVWFGVDLPPVTGGPLAPAPGPAAPPSSQGRDGADGAPGRDGNDVRSSDSQGDPGNDSNVST